VIIDVDGLAYRALHAYLIVRFVAFETVGVIERAFRGHELIFFATGCRVRLTLRKPVLGGLLVLAVFARRACSLPKPAVRAGIKASGAVLLTHASWFFVLILVHVRVDRARPAITFLESGVSFKELAKRAGAVRCAILLAVATVSLVLA
jgi:hypothetical protein